MCAIKRDNSLVMSFFVDFELELLTRYCWSAQEIPLHLKLKAASALINLSQ